MKEYVLPIVVALLGLCGTAAGIAFAYRRWLQERRAERSKAYREDRQKAYKELWQRAEQLSVDGRVAELSDEEFSRRIAEVNTFMMTANVYVDDADRGLVNDYVRAARAFHAALRALGDAATQRALGDTGLIPEDTLRKSEPLYAAHKDALTLRDALLAKVRAVVSGSADGV